MTGLFYISLGRHQQTTWLVNYTKQSVLHNCQKREYEVMTNVFLDFLNSNVVYIPSQVVIEFDRALKISSSF